MSHTFLSKQLVCTEFSALMQTDEICTTKNSFLNCRVLKWHERISSFIGPFKILFAIWSVGIYPFAPFYDTNYRILWKRGEDVGGKRRNILLNDMKG